MLIALFITFIIIIFPFFIDIKTFLSSERKKLFFWIDLFGLNVFSGEIRKDNSALILTGKNGKVKVYTLNDVKGKKSKIKSLKDYNVIKIHSLIETGNNSKNISPQIISFIYNYTSYYIIKYVRYKKPYLEITNDINIYEEDEIFNYFFDVRFIINILVILLNLIKKIIGGFILWITKKTTD